jgi:hypothetical protein
VSGTLVLDCEGLSKLVRRTPDLTEWLAATALSSLAPVTVLTSDPEDLLALCGPGTRILKV